MICGNCHTENPEGNKFCGNCGLSLAAACANCGANNAPGQKFCGQCGSSLTAIPATPTTASTTERRLVTVLFADLTGYTSFAEGRDSEDTREFLGKYFDRSRETIERFGGKVEKFIGDAVMAVWGADVAHEDDAERAVRAGFELTDLVDKLATEEGAPNLALRVGVNTGEAAVGPGEGHMGFVTGDLVNTASRLETAAAPGGVLVGEVTMQSASKAIAFESAGEQDLKGKSLPVKAWRALRLVSEVGGRGKAETLEPPFVGRAEELRLLKDLLDKVGRESRSKTVSVVGEAGIGKSRLVWEFLKYIDGLVENIYWHEGRSPSYGDGVTFWAVGDMIRRRAGILETDPDDVAFTKLDEALETHVSDTSERSWIRPRVAAVLGIGDAPPSDRAELDAAVRAFFEGVSEQGTTVLVFEDLHWGDEALLDFIDELNDWWRTKPILVVTLARQDLLERRPSWGTGRPGVVSLTLGVLSDFEMAEMVGQTVPGLPEDAVGSIVQRSAGVPLYAVELLRSLISAGEIEVHDGNYVVTGDVSDLAVPESLQAVIGARLDRLDPEDRNLVQDAAVLGHTFSLPALSVITGRSTEDLEGHVTQLTRRELVEPIRDLQSPERGQYRFLQGLIRDVALSRMSRENRRKRHLAVAEHMEAQDDPEIAVVIASHYLQALEATPGGPEHDRIKERALASVLAAANRARSLRAADQVISISEKGLELTENDTERAPFWENLLFGLTDAGERDLAEKYGQMALEYHRAARNEVDTWRISRELGYFFIVLGQRDRAVQLLKPLIEAHPDFDSHPELAKAGIVYCRALMLQNLPEGDTMDNALRAAEKHDLTAYVVDGIITKAGFADRSGRLTEAKILLNGAIELADRYDLTEEGTRGRNNLAFVLAGLDLGEALRIGEQAVATAHKTGTRAAIQWQLGQRAMMLAHLGQLDELEQLLADPFMDGLVDDVLVARRYAEGFAAMLRGKLDLAQELLDESADLADPKDPQAAGWTRGGRACLEVFRGNPDSVLAQTDDLDGSDWWNVMPMWWPLTFAAVVRGDEEQLAKTSAFLGSYAPRFSEFSGLLDALMRMADAPDATVREIEGLARESAEIHDRVFLPVFQFGIAKYLPDGHARKQKEASELRSRLESWGFQGLIDLMDRFIT